MLLRSASDAADLLRPLVAARPDEALAVAHLDEAGKLLEISVRGGGADLVALSLRDVLTEGLRLGARAIVIAHNHPSGDAAPSEADIAVTRRLADLCEAVGIRFCDHLIFGGQRCSSLRAMGLL